MREEHCKAALIACIVALLVAVPVGFSYFMSDCTVIYPDKYDIYAMAEDIARTEPDNFEIVNMPGDFLEYYDGWGLCSKGWRFHADDKDFMAKIEQIN